MAAPEIVPFSKIRKGQSFTYKGVPLAKINKTQGETWGGDKITISADEKVTKPPKRLSKVEQWNQHCSDARCALESAQELVAGAEYEKEEGIEYEGSDKDITKDSRFTSAKESMVDALNALAEMASEYGETFDNMPEGAQASPYGQKCSEMQNLDLEADSDMDLDELESKLDEAEGAELPLGFGRD